ncbi:MAG TPA: DUF3124 domain-containing protein [Gallionella sp.]|nr:DUF3124 domain-containing protein [Gallionella sp.]
MKVRLSMLLLALCASSAAAEELSSGQALYLPIYSHIWHGDRIANKQPVKSLVSALVSIRNTSLKTPIRIVSARYYSTEGKLLREYLPKPVEVGAMGTFELFVERKESAGGSGANFVIQWDAAAQTNPPVVEAVHADIKGGGPAVSFVTTARPIAVDK